uniref:Uncharacterized protein n=1 Tax=Leersia perrieri TaxID=77586 RepID=A0A0D9W941_9ORYZ
MTKSEHRCWHETFVPSTTMFTFGHGVGSGGDDSRTMPVRVPWQSHQNKRACKWVCSEPLISGGQRGHGAHMRHLQADLYLVMDDWEEGYGIYRVDVDTFDPDAEFDSDSEAECEARPRDLGGVPSGRKFSAAVPHISACTTPPTIMPRVRFHTISNRTCPSP